MVKLASPKQLKELQDLHDDIDFYLRAADKGEQWGKAITDDPETFKRLVLLEGKIENTMGGYFKSFANERVVDLVNWQQYSQELQAMQIKQAADTFKVDVNINLLDKEEQTLIQVLLNLIFNGYKIGTDAAINLYHIPADYQTIIDAAEREARAHAADLAKHLNKTTHNTIKNSVANSLTLGEDNKAAADRLRKVVNSPVRAKMIAQSESTNAWGGGVQNFGKRTGAKGKVWSSVLDGHTTPICIQLAGKYGSAKKAIPLNEPFVFTAMHGGAVMSPGAHVNCRSGMYLTY